MPNLYPEMQAIASGRLVLNAVECDACQQVVWSEHRHDYRECGCGLIAVDGGLDYLRRVGDGEYTELSLYLDGGNQGRRAVGIREN